MICEGATPGGSGVFGLSLAPADIQVFGIRLLIASDPINLITSGNFGYDAMGELIINSASRQGGLLAGIQVFIQFFESSPIIRESNGIRMLLAS